MVPTKISLTGQSNTQHDSARAAIHHIQHRFYDLGKHLSSKPTAGADPMRTIISLSNISPGRCYATNHHATRAIAGRPYVAYQGATAPVSPARQNTLVKPCHGYTQSAGLLLHDHADYGQPGCCSGMSHIYRLLACSITAFSPHHL